MGERDVDLAQVFPLEGLMRRYQWLGPMLLTLVVAVWLCVDAYLETGPQPAPRCSAPF